MLDRADILSDLGPTLRLMDDAVMVTESNLAKPGPRIVFINSAFAALTGYAEDEIIGRTLDILCGANTDRRVLNRLVNDLENHQKFTDEGTFYRKDGSEFLVEWQIVPLLGPDGQPQFWLSILRNGSRWKSTERNQHDSEEMYRHLVENQPDLICRFLPDTTLTYVNIAYARFFDSKAEDLVGRKFLDFLADQDREEVVQCLASATHLHPAVRREQQTRAPDGRVSWHLWHNLAMFDEHGELKLFQAVGTDITKRKNAEEALRESEGRIRAITDSLPSRISYLDKHQRYRFANKAYETVFGIEKEAINGKHLKELIGEDAYRSVEENIIRALSGETIHFELVRNHRGNEMVEDITFVPDLDTENNSKGIYVLINDVTNRKRAENETRASKEFLDNVLNAIDDPVFVKDENHNWVILNDKACTLLGAPRSELIGKSDFDYFAKQQAEHHWEMDSEVLNSNCAMEFKEKIWFDGQLRTFLTKKARFVESSTGCPYIVGMTRDVSEFAHVQAALFKEKERAEVTLHCITDAVITTDAKGQVEFMNPVAEALTGWPVQDAKGRKLPMVCRLIDERTRKPSPDIVATCLARGNIVAAADHSILINRDGSEFAVEGSAAPMRAGTGEIPGVVLVFHDVTDSRRMAKQLAHDAAHDPLTLLVNRREFERRLERELNSARQYGSRHALCYIDLDQFKIINDTAGHAAGDELLKQVRGLLTGKFRERDTLARLGGDEFALLLDNCAIEEALRICEIIVATFRAYRFEWQGRAFQVGASIGLVPVTAEAESTAQLLAQADVACYTAKDLGRSRVHVYPGEGGVPSPRHNEILLAVNLREALEAERFCLHYQPIVPLSNRGGPDVRYEVLLRMLNADDTLLAPHAFIPAAERFGLMPAIDRWVIRTAFRRFGSQFAHIPGAEISINLSGASLGEESLLAYVREQFDVFSVPPSSVCFEITETAAIQNLSHALNFTSAVKRAGSRLALDDFGSGLSSFRYLKTLPADYLKIDGSFVRDMLENPVDHAMVEAINEVGHVMGIKTIAEYVHSRPIMDRLKLIGVDCAQGFAIGKPVPLQ